MSKLSGMVDKILSKTPGQGQYGPYTRTDFQLRTVDGKTLKIQTFGDFPADLHTKWISFDATHNAKYNTYAMAKGKYEVIESQAPEVVPTATKEEVLVKKERPKRSYSENPETTTEPVREKAESKVTAHVKNLVKDSGREDYRSEAEASVRKNLDSAARLARESGFPNATLGEIAELADLIGRTQTAIFMDNQKTARVNDMKATRK